MIIERMQIKSAAICDADIIRQVRLKNEAGASGLYDKYAVALMLVIIRKIPLKATADDVLCKSFLEIWHSFYLYHEDEGKLFTWMKAVTSGIADDFIIGKSTSRATIS